ncbi:hypothetical protein RND81_03G076800 [Saponaria officinalis]|uniref:Uncharacterized protein n=1 Tax=Saponaria officinalis TaxID=3572 RepID=A0AAW1M5L4_SAPOF
MAGVEWPVIGIDLGTTCSCVAVWWNNRVEIIPNELGNRTTPSYVSFTDSDRLVGEAAVNQATMNPLNTIFDAKRLIGRRYSDNNLQNNTDVRPFKVINGIESDKKDQPMISVNYLGKEKKFTPEEVSAMTLAKMKSVAEAFTGSIVNNAVISVPAFFNDLQRRATKDAGIIAGFKVVHIINEPTAIAMAYYDLEMKMNRINMGPKNVLVFDLGGGTFDVSLVVIEKGKIKVKAVSGDTHLGGADFDNRMVREFVREFEQKHGKGISKNARALGRLRVASEKAKKVLTLLPQADVQIDCLFEGLDFNTTITRARFEHLNMDLFKKCINIVEQCLYYAGLNNKKVVHDVVLVGGSSRIPKVQEMLQAFFKGKELCKRVHADEAVAYGAAMHAFSKSNVTSTNKDIVVSDVVPLPLGVGLNDGAMGIVIRRNEPIPIIMREPTYNLCLNEYNGFEFGVYEGGETEFKYNFLGVCEFYGSYLHRGTTNIYVNFSVDEDGLLSVSAEIKKMGRLSQIINMNRHGQLTQMEIDRMIKEAEQFKAQDEKRRKLLQNKSALESYVNFISDRLDDINNKDKLERVEIAIDSAFRLLDKKLDLYSEFPVYAHRLVGLKIIYEHVESR